MSKLFVESQNVVRADEDIGDFALDDTVALLMGEA